MTQDARDGTPPEASAPVPAPSPREVPPGEPARSAKRLAFFLHTTLGVLLVFTLVNLVRLAIAPRSTGGGQLLPTAAGVQQIVGPVPTDDPMTWMCMPGALLWKTVAAVDGEPETRLTREQGDGIRAALKDLRGLSTAQNEVWSDLSYAMQSTLTRTQLQLLASNRTRLSTLACTMDSEVEAVLKKARGQHADLPTASSSPSSEVTLDWTSDELAAGLLFLEKSKDPLSPAQAARLVTPLQAYRDNKRQMGTYVRQAVLVFRPPQLKALVSRLQEARRKGTYDEQGRGVDGEATLAALGVHDGATGKSPAP